MAILSLLMILACCPSYAQISVSGTATGKHQRWIEQLRFRISQAKTIDNLTPDQLKIDTTIAPRIDSSYIEKKRQKMLDSLTQAGQLDSIAKAKMKFYQSLANDSIYSMDMKDSISFSYDSEHQRHLIEQYAEQWANEYAIDGLPDQPGFTDPNPFGTNPDFSREVIPANPLDQQSSPMASMNRIDDRSVVASQKLNRVLTQMSESDVKQAATTTGSLKEKYRSLQTSNDLTTGIKQNSLKGSQERRIQIGGNINVPSTDPLITELNAQLGFRITRKWTVGFGGSTREQYRKEYQSSGDSFGYYVFSSYDIIYGLFAYTEYKRLKTGSLLNRHEDETAYWNQTVYLGIGKEAQITPWLALSVLFVYDLNGSSSELSSKPYEFRIGYRIKAPSHRNRPQN